MAFHSSHPPFFNLSVIGSKLTTYFCEFSRHSCYGKYVMLLQGRQQIKVSVTTQVMEAQWGSAFPPCRPEEYQ